MDIRIIEKKFKSLANRRRLSILHLLSSRKEATVSEIAGEINLSFKATSKHLQVLKNVGFIDSEQVNLEQHYFLVNKSDVFIRHVISIL